MYIYIKKYCFVGFFLESIDLTQCEEPSTAAFVNHQGPIHGLQVHQDLLYTCSEDTTARVHSLVVSMRKRLLS